MQRKHLLGTLVLTILLLTACVIRPIANGPTDGPVRNGSSGNGGRWEIVASRNCVEVGEVVTFTATIANETDEAIELTGNPSIDIVVRPAKWQRPEPLPVVQWSASDQYPRRIESVMAPDERRTYEWYWTADAAFAQQPRGFNNAHVAFKFGEILNLGGISTPPGELPIEVGIGSLNWAGDRYVTCADLRRSR